MYSTRIAKILMNAMNEHTISCHDIHCMRFYFMELLTHTE